MANDESKYFGPKKKARWALIGECIGEFGNRKILQLDSVTNTYPFMLAAVDDSCPSNVDLLYYLLRKHPTVARLAEGSMMESDNPSLDPNRKRICPMTSW